MTAKKTPSVAPAAAEGMATHGKSSNGATVIKHNATEGIGRRLGFPPSSVLLLGTKLLGWKPAVMFFWVSFLNTEEGVLSSKLSMF